MPGIHSGFCFMPDLSRLLLWLSASLKGRITDQMRLAWRASLAKVDLNRGESKTRDGAGAALIVVSAGLALIALYPMPAWVGYDLPKAPASLQTFIDRITHPYFQSFAFAILITMWLSDSTIARFRLKDAYKQFITSIKLKIRSCFFCGHLPGRRLCFRQPLSFQYSRQFWPLLPTRGEASRAGGLRPGRHEAVQAGFRRQLPEHLPVESVPRGHSRRIRHRQRLHAGRRHARAARELSVRHRAGWRMVVSWRAIQPGWNAAPRFSSGKSADSAAALGQFGLLAAAYPIKRTFDRPFGHVIVRYGETGNEENFIDGRATAERSPGRDIQGHPQRANVRLSEQAGERCLPRACFAT